MGTLTGTVRHDPGTASSGPHFITNVGETAYFAANNGTTGDELWKSDGTGSGTALRKDIRAGASSFRVI